MTDEDHNEASSLADCEVRQAEPEDADTLAEFNLAMARETEGRTLEPGVVAAGVRAVLGDPDRGRYFVAEHQGRPCGMAMITYEWSDWHNAWFWWLQSVYVQPERRRRGVFAALLHHITREARRRGDVCGIRLYVDRDNTSAINTYNRLGIAGSRYLVHECEWSAGQSE